MRLNWHIPLPGPFSIGGPVVPRIKRPRKRPATRACRCQHASRPLPGPPNPRPQDRTLTDSGTSGGTIALWLLGLTVVILAILGFGGFRL